ncbi:hypothetical protein [Microcystis phage Mae-JY24]
MEIQQTAPATPELPVIVPPYQVALAQADPTFTTRGNVYALPQSVDDAERQVGIQLYQQMMTDDVVAGVSQGIVDEVMSEPMRFMPALDPPSPYAPADPDYEARYAQAKRIADFVDHAIHAADRSGLTWSATIVDLLNAMWFGHRLAEATYRVEEGGDWDGMEVLDALRVLDRRQYTVVTDYAYRWLGALIKQPGNPALRSGPLSVSLQNEANYVPREKLLMLTWNPVNGNPLGQSALRAAYTHWRKKQEFHPVDARFVTQFGGGVVVITLPENLPPTTADPSDPAKQIKTSDAYLAVARELASGKGAVVPFGTEVDRKLPDAKGEAIEAGFDRANRGIAMAISSSVRAFLESRNGSRADSGDASNRLNLRVSRIRAWLCETIRHQLVEVLVRRNFGRDAARDYLPRVVMASGAQEDFASNSQAVAQLVTSGAVTPAMRRELAERLGLTWVDEDDEQASNETDGTA